jgi:hypothetical protein
MEKEGFIYIWYDRKRKMYYIGCHWGTIDDGYICSSRWMRKSYKRRPQDFKRRILQRGLEKKGLKEYEVKWLSLIKTEELGTRYYNLSKILTGNGWKKGKPRSEETKKRVSEGLKRAYENGCKVWNKGKQFSAERKARISEDTKRGMAALSEETKDKMRSTQFKSGQSSWNKGKKNWRIVSVEEKEKRKSLAIAMHKDGKFGNKGRSWFTNGTSNVMLFPHEDVPFGFYKGRVFHD